MNTENFNGKSILDVFDITNIDHIKEFIHVQNNGQLKEDSIFLECELPILWQVSITGKLADGYIHYWYRL